jgi:hypothetical protein
VTGISASTLDEAGLARLVIGVLGTGKEWLNPGRSIDERGDAPKGIPEPRVVVQGVFDKRRLLAPRR